MESKYYITIGRQLGAGGLEIAKKLSEIFGIPVYDKELINIASKESGLCCEVFENADEIPRKSARGLFGLLFSGVAYNNLGNRSVLDEAELFRIQGEVIRDIASKQSAIFVGRCADYILREHPRCMSVFITANDADRVARLRLSKKWMVSRICRITNWLNICVKRIRSVQNTTISTPTRIGATQPLMTCASTLQSSAPTSVWR